MDILFPKSLAVRLVSNCHPVVSGVLGATLNLRRSKDPVAKSLGLCVNSRGPTLFPFTKLCRLHCHLWGITDVSSLILVNLVCQYPLEVVGQSNC